MHIDSDAIISGAEAKAFLYFQNSKLNLLLF